MELPDKYNLSIQSIRFENRSLIFVFDRIIKNDWFQVIAYGSYSYTAIWGYETNNLQMRENTLLMPLKGYEEKSTVEEIVHEVRDWVKM